MRPASRIAACALLVSACVEPVQYGGRIPVDTGGLEARLERLCVLTGQTTGCETLAAPLDEEEAEQPGSARRDAQPR